MAKRKRREENVPLQSTKTKDTNRALVEGGKSKGKDKLDIKSKLDNSKAKKTRVKEKKDLKNPSPADQLLLPLKANSDQPWYQVIKIKENWNVSTQNSDNTWTQYVALGKELYDKQVKLYESVREMSRSDREWLKTVAESGTAKDKVTLYSLQIQESPFYLGPAYLEKLMEMFNSTSRHESLLALDALREAFISILPTDQTVLYYWKQRNFSNSLGVTDHDAKNHSATCQLSLPTLLRCHFEEVIKRYFFKFLKSMEIFLQDQITHVREQATRALWKLAMATAEQRTNILSLLANKLGDTERKLASRVGYYLEEVIKSHNDCAVVIVGQLQQLIQRPGVSEKAQYYAILCCSQIRLSHKRPELTEKLIQIYLTAFKAIVIPSLKAAIKHRREVRRKSRRQATPKVKAVVEEEPPIAELSRVAKAVLTGLNRALPYFKGNIKKLQTDLIGPIEELTKSNSLSTIIQSLSLYLHIVTLGSETTIIDNSKFLEKFVVNLGGIFERDELAIETSVQPTLLALLYRATSMEQMTILWTMRLIKIMFKSTLRIPSVAYVAAALLLMHDLVIVKPGVRAMFTLLLEADSLSNRPTLDKVMEKEGKGANGGGNRSGEVGETLYEVVYLAQNHFDPRIREYARTLLKGESVASSFMEGSPFECMTMTRYLVELGHAKDGKAKPTTKQAQADDVSGANHSDEDLDIDSENVDLDEVGSDVDSVIDSDGDSNIGSDIGSDIESDGMDNDNDSGMDSDSNEEEIEYEIEDNNYESDSQED